MRPAKIDRHTVALHPPRDWDREVNGHCGVLYVREEKLDGVSFMRSAWEVEPHEAALIFAGAKLITGIAGAVERTGHPVINLALESLPEDFAPFVTARQFATLTGQPAVRVEVLYPNRGDPQRGMVEVALEGLGLAGATARGIEEVEALARREGWIE